MSSPLPAGWLDCSKSLTFTLSASVELENAFGKSLVFDGFSPFLSPYISITTRINGANVEAHLTYNDAGGAAQDFVIASAAGPAAGYLPAFTVQKQVGPLRLGATINGSNALVYAWFADAATVSTWTVAGHVVKTSNGTDPPVIYPASTADAGAGPSMTTGTNGRVSNIQFNGSGLGLGPFSGEGGLTRFFSAPTSFTIDLDTIDSDGTAVAANATCYGAQTCPAVFTQTQQHTGIGTVGGTFGLNTAIAAATFADPWLSAQAVTPFVEEQGFTFEGNDPKNPSTTTQTAWNVGSLTVNSPLSVLQSSNAWAVDTGAATIGGTPQAPTFMVTSAPAVVRKEVLSHWRNWNTPGDPLYVAGEGYTATARNAYSVGGATPDVWGWSVYAYLDVDLQPAAAGALSFEITWAVITEGGSVLSVVKTYNATWGAGRSTQRLDLLFPNEIGRPMHGERVDRIRISGLQAGTTTLYSMSLVAVQDAYVKFGGQCQDPYWLRDRIAGSSIPPQLPAGVMIAQDGQYVFSQWGGDPLLSPVADTDQDLVNDHNQDHQNGLFGGSTVGAVTSFGGSPGKLTETLSAWFTELSRLEGLTASYSSTAINAALTDSFGNSLTSAPTAIWIKPSLPHARVSPNVALTVNARCVVLNVTVPTGLATGDIRIFQRNRLGMVLEALAVDANANRVGAGSTVRAKRTTAFQASGADAIATSATTDASGFVTLPVRTGLIGGSYFQYYLEGV